MEQPIPKNIKEKNPKIGLKTFNTLLVDGSNVLEYSYRGYKKVNTKGNEVGGIFQMLLQLKILLQKGNFRYVYVFWDGIKSGQLRVNECITYKSNRDKIFDVNELSDYMKEVNERIKNMTSYFQKNNKKNNIENDDIEKDDKEIFHWQRDIVMECLEELCIRQCLCDYTEADDFIGYYVSHKKPNERIVICSNDRDLTQLISEDCIVYIQSLHDFINIKNHTDKFGYNYQNVLLKKILCGDSSDNIKGISGFGDKTLLTNFPEIKERKVTLEEIIEKATKINEERINSKKKPLKWAENIKNRITNGVQGERIYEINKKIIDLKNPIMTDEAKELIDSIMYAPMDCSDRSIENLYKIISKYDIDELSDSNKFSSFFIEFKYLMDKEIKNIEI